jgi:hypothetical protein
VVLSTFFTLFLPLEAKGKVYISKLRLGKCGKLTQVNIFKTKISKPGLTDAKKEKDMM